MPYLSGHVHRFLLHVIRHVRILYHCFSVSHFRCESYNVALLLQTSRTLSLARLLARYKTSCAQCDWLVSNQCQQPVTTSSRGASLRHDLQPPSSLYHITRVRARVAMESLDSRCTPLKTKYDECFNTWFRGSFLKGRGHHEDACGRLFAEYKACVKVFNNDRPSLHIYIPLSCMHTRRRP